MTQDAEDVVADALVRWLRTDRTEVHEPAAFLTTVVSRLALDQLRSARTTREAYVGPWLPEPMIADPESFDPLDSLVKRETLSLATLRLMEELTPPERAVFVLREAFDIRTHRSPRSSTSPTGTPASCCTGPRRGWTRDDAATSRMRESTPS